MRTAPTTSALHSWYPVTQRSCRDHAEVRSRRHPETFYLLAVSAPRTANTKMLYENLMKACQDANLKAQAKGDREFYNYANTPEFQSIVK